MTVAAVPAHQKFDSGKPRFSLLPAMAVQSVAEVFTFGANKYGDDNWYRCADPTRYADAAMRHILADLAGDLLDDESGLLHISHAIASLLMYQELRNRQRAPRSGLDAA